MDLDRLEALRKMPYSEYLLTPEWKERRERALEQARHHCQLCNSPDLLETHHRTYERRGNEDDEDLIVLCDSCHKHFHQRMSPSETEKTDPVSTVLENILTTMKEIVETGSSSSTISTGYSDIDRCLGGFHSSELVYLASRDGHGSMELALNIAYNAAKANHTVCIFSPIMLKEMVVNHFISIHSHIPWGGCFSLYSGR